MEGMINGSMDVPIANRSSGLPDDLANLNVTELLRLSHDVDRDPPKSSKSPSLINSRSPSEMLTSNRDSNDENDENDDVLSELSGPSASEPKETLDID